MANAESKGKEAGRKIFPWFQERMGGAITGNSIEIMKNEKYQVSTYDQG